MEKKNKSEKSKIKVVLKETKSISKKLPFKDTYKNTFKYKDNTFMDIIQIKTKDLYNASEDEVNMDLYILTQLNKAYLEDYKLISVNFPTNTKTQQMYYTHKINHCSNPNFKKILQQDLNEMVDAELTSTNREHYIMLFGKNYENLVNNRNTVLSILGSKLAEEISLSKKIQLLFMMANKSTSIFYSDEADKYIARADKDDLVKEYGYNPHLLNSIQPKGNISFSHEDYVRTGDGFESCIYVYDYPKRVDRHWLNILTNNSDTITTIDVSSVKNSFVKNNLAKSISEYRTQARTGNDVDKMEAEIKKDKLQALAYEVNSYGEVIKRIVTRIFVSSKTYEGLQKHIKAILENLEDNEYKGTVNINEQEFEWTSMYKSATVQKKEPFGRKGKDIRSSTLGGGNPFHFTFLNDKYGSLLGHTTTSGVDGKAFFDLFHNDNQRTSYNMVVVGEMGMGKSTLVKKQVRERAARGDFIRIMDITGEFTTIIKNLGGQVVSLDGSDGILNPLQIYKAADTDKESFTMHLSKLSTMYKFIAPESNHSERLIFETAVRKLYEKYKLTPETIDKGRILTELSATEYPIFEDIIPLVDEFINKETNTETQNYLRNIKRVIEDLCYNYGNIFNGHTTINDLINTQIVSYNIKTLSQLKSEVFDAQLFSGLALCWANAVKVGSQMKNLYEEGRIRLEDIKHFILVLDESHNTINSSKPEAVRQITKYAREGRKYFAGLIFASQSVRDYVPENTSSDDIKKLFELCTYKFVFKQDANSKKLIAEIFEEQFNQTEIHQIPYLKRGQAILNIKSVKNIVIDVYVTNEELAVYKGGL